MMTASHTLARRLSQGLYGKAEFLENCCPKAETISLMRLFHYFPYEHFASLTNNQSLSNNFKEFIGSSPHTDWGFLTLILQDPGGGLQIYHNQKWMDVPYVAGALVANAGDYLSLVTNGNCLSPVHRVLLNKRERYSLVFFYYPDFDAVVPNFENDLNIATKGKAFNTLLDGTVRNVNGCFGEYHMDKWANVQREV